MTRARLLSFFSVSLILLAACSDDAPPDDSGSDAIIPPINDVGEFFCVDEASGGPVAGGSVLLQVEAAPVPNQAPVVNAGLDLSAPPGSSINFTTPG